MGACAAALGPGVAGASKAVQNAEQYGAEAFASATMDCPALNEATGKAKSALLKTIDDKILCTVMCCCSRQHEVMAAADRASGIKPTRKKQDCVRETLDAADRELDFGSRYKAEVYYNMTKEPPTPFMHRVDGAMTTQKTRGGFWRIWRDIPDYQKYDARRPDVVIVKDPALPPTQDNIERIVEMKFRNDHESDSNQFSDYGDIAGSRTKVGVMTEGADCKCQDGKRQPETVPVSSRQEQAEPSTSGSALEAVGWGGLTVLGAVATVALALIPFDGPAGEAAAGVGTMAAASRFARAWGALFSTGSAAGALP
jgi:hypothetical protein